VTVGLDTSVVLRLLVGAPAAEARAARERLQAAHERGDSILVTDLVLAEAYFALHYHYGIPKAEARAKLLAMATSRVVTLSPPDAVWALKPSSGAGLVDRLVHARHRSEGAVSWTFDRKMATLEGAVRIASPVRGV
jgi:predicted nucleic acid-binding protein